MLSNEKIILPSNKKFGTLFYLMFFITGCYFLIEALFVLGSFLIACSFLTSLITFVRPSLLTIPNRLWMQLGLYLSYLVSPLILGLIFFGIFTPIAIFFRLFKRDELNLRIIKKRTFWKTRNVDYQERMQFEKQF